MHFLEWKILNERLECAQEFLIQIRIYCSVEELILRTLCFLAAVMVV